MARTWVGEPVGVTWERLTEIFRTGEDRPLVTARTIWVLLDAATGRPRRIRPRSHCLFHGTGRGRSGQLTASVVIVAHPFQPLADAFAEPAHRPLRAAELLR